MNFSFTYPLGLLGLIGIPILIIIYIIKNKYTEQTVSTTYIWRLSEKFLKKKKKLPKIAGIISLILQLLSVAAISLIIAKPVFVYHNSANEYCFVLDGSGSMSATKDDKTRFDLGKDKIKELIKGSMNGSTYTLIYATDTSTDKVFELISDKDEAIERLDSLTVSYSSEDMDEAMNIAQEYVEENSAAIVYLISDKSYAVTNNVEYINVAREEVNFGISNPQPIISGSSMSVSARIKAYGDLSEDKNIDVYFYLDKSETPIAKRVTISRETKEASISFTTTATGYNSFRLVMDIEDSLSSDNSLSYYNPNSTSTYSTIIVSNTPSFLEAIIETITNTDVLTVSTEDYDKATENPDDYDFDTTGYSLYVFDSYAPKSLPTTGTVWFFNLQESVDGVGFSIQSEVTLNEAIRPTLAEPDSTTIERLTLNMHDINNESLYVKKYMKYGVSHYDEIYTYNKLPLVFALENTYENREIVFAFSLHDSNLPALPEFGILMRNLIEYSFPDILEIANYNTGDKLEINIPAGYSDISIKSPSGKMEYPTSSAAANEYVLNEPGTYEIELKSTLDPNSSIKINAYAVLCDGESDINATAEYFSLTKADTGEGGRDGFYDDLIIFIIILTALFTLDWVVYCYDKYQLR